MIQGLPRIARLYVFGLAALAIATLAGAFTFVPLELTQRIVITAAVLTVLSLLLEFIDFPLLISGGTSFSTVTYMAMVFMLRAVPCAAALIFSFDLPMPSP